MKKLLVLLFIPLLSGCALLQDNSERLSHLVDTALRQDPGWNMSGYVIMDNSREIKIGSISSEILYEMAHKEPRGWKLEEDVKDEGFIFGISFRKTF